jgi:hypothetical protein
MKKERAIEFAVKQADSKGTSVTLSLSWQVLRYLPTDFDRGVTMFMFHFDFLVSGAEVASSKTQHCLTYPAFQLQ